MAYVQKNNPFAQTGCGRRRNYMTVGNSSPVKNKEKEYNKLSERFEGFNTANDTLIIGRSNSSSGATFQNKMNRMNAVDKGKMNSNVDDSKYLEKNGQWKYVTKHKKK